MSLSTAVLAYCTSALDPSAFCFYRLDGINHHHRFPLISPFLIASVSVTPPLSVPLLTRCFQSSPIRIHLAVKSAALHSHVSWGWFAIRSSGCGFTSTGDERGRETRGAGKTSIYPPPPACACQCPSVFFPPSTCSSCSQNTCLRAKGLGETI